MLKKVLVANRGEIACRVIRTCRELGIRTVAIASQSDRGSLHVRLADETVIFPDDSASDTYLNQSAILAAVRDKGADAVHPGYGFLAENAGFAALIEEAGLVFVGPSSHAIAQLGDKVSARGIAQAVGVPLVPGSTQHVETADLVLDFGAMHGWPVAIKAVHGGGGRGMRVVRQPGEAQSSLDSARAEALAAFGNGSLYLERYLEQARHVEVQIFADRHGTALWLGDRDCSVQRLHQKVIEEAPAPGLSDEMRRDMGEASVRLAKHVGYVGAGTVEFLVAGDKFYFLEVNTRIQVEHPVTEMVLGLDLVREQLLVAGGSALAWKSGATPRGHAVECRVNAEDPTKGFRPAPGQITTLALPWRPGLRFDSGYEAGDRIPPFYDSLVGKVIAWAPNRELSVLRLGAALADTLIAGVPTTIPLVREALAHPDFAAGPVHTRWLEAHLDELLAKVPSHPVLDGVAVAPPAPAVDHHAWIGSRRYRIPTAPVSALNKTRSARSAPGSAMRGGGSATVSSTGRISSPIHGVVLSLLVEVGQSVLAGDPLMSVEAMKMENIVSAPFDGTVASIEVILKQSVGSEQHLMTLTPAD